MASPKYTYDVGVNTKGGYQVHKINADQHSSLDPDVMSGGPYWIDFTHDGNTVARVRASEIVIIRRNTRPG